MKPRLQREAVSRRSIHLIDNRTNAAGEVPIEGQIVIDDAGLIDALRNGQTYVNIHTDANRSGEIRGQLEQPTDFTITTSLDSDQVPGELSGDTSAATGQGQLSYDATSNTLSWEVTFDGLTSAATLAHIHGPALAGDTAGVLINLAPAGPPTSPLTGSTNPEWVTLAHVVAGLTYFNIHTETNGSGEIRGQIELPVELEDDIFEDGFESTDNGSEITLSKR